MSIRKTLAMSLALMGALSACGQLVAQPVAAGRSAEPVPPAPVTAPPALSQGLAALEGVRHRLASCRGFETEMTSQAEGTWDDGVDTSVRRTQRNRAHLRWSKPHQTHGEMLEAPFALMVGGTLDTSDSFHLTLRPRGLFSVVALTIEATDVKLRNSRNHTFRDSHPAAQLTRLTAPAAAWTVTAQSADAVSVEVTGVRKLDGGIERERLVFSARDLSPKSLSMLADGRSVVTQTFWHFRWR